MSRAVKIVTRAADVKRELMSTGFMAVYCFHRDSGTASLKFRSDVVKAMARLLKEQIGDGRPLSERERIAFHALGIAE